jgi:hypothetical protein
MLLIFNAGWLGALLAVLVTLLLIGIEGYALSVLIKRA